MSKESDKRPDTGTDRTPSRRAAKRPAGGGRFAVGVSLLTLLIVIGLVSGAGWGWYWLEERLDRLAELESAQAEQAEQLEALDRQTDDLAELPGQISGLDQALSDTRSVQSDLQSRTERLDERTEALRTFIDAGRSAWRVAEVEYLLRVANSELQIADRPESALSALEAADERLERLADPALVPVREALSDDIERLRAMPRPDVAGLSLTLSSLIERIDALPIGARRLSGPASSETESPDDGFWARLRQRGTAILSDMVTVRHEDMPVRPLLAPEQEYFLRRNLSLKLETARLALLRGEAETWRASLDEARRWLETWYETEDPAVTAMDDALERLMDSRIRADRPDISSALERLRGIREARD